MNRILIGLVFAFGLQGGSMVASTRITEEEFRSLARDLARKVTFFQEIWDVDPQAVFYGGTTRDFLYWIMRQLGSSESPADLALKMEKLRQLPFIDIKSIVGGESDVDVISRKAYLVRAEDFGVRKVDIISPERLDPKTDLGKNEADQGFIPAEKIELSQEGLKVREGFGNGVNEILTGELSVHFTYGEQFLNSYYAKRGLNHQVLLAIRYIRLRALHWYNTHGSGTPDLAELFNFDLRTRMELRKIFKDARVDPHFQNFIRQPKGLVWLKRTVLKSFRSYTNPTAAYYLFKEFGYNELQEFFPVMETINQFLFIQYRDPEKIKKNFAEFNLKPETVYIPFTRFSKASKIYHGTRTEESFRAILFQNILPSDSMRSAGSGLYGVDSRTIKYAAEVAQSRDRVVVFDVSPSAKLIDITDGIGEELFNKWKMRNPQRSYDDFAADFGADILKYPYGEVDAYVVKNSAVLVGRQGLTRQLLTTTEVLEMAEKVSTLEQYQAVIHAIQLNRFSKEPKLVLERTAGERLIRKVISDVKEAADLRALVNLEPMRNLTSEVRSRMYDLIPPQELRRLTLDLVKVGPWRARLLEGEGMRPFDVVELLERKPFENHEALALQFLARIVSAVPDSSTVPRMENFLETLFFRTGLSSGTITQMGDLLLRSGESYAEWLLERSFFSPKDHPELLFTEGDRDRWVERALSQKNGRPSTGHHFFIFGLTKRLFSGVAISPQSKMTPKSKVSYDFYLKIGRWIDAMIKSGSIDSQILASRILFSDALDPATQPAWKTMPRYDEWMNLLMSRMTSVGIDGLLAHFGFGPEFSKAGPPNEQSIQWLKVLLQKKILNPMDRRNLMEDIVSRNLVFPEAMDFMLEFLVGSPETIGQIFPYLKANAPADPRAHRVITNALRFGFEDFRGVLFVISNWIIEDPEAQANILKLASLALVAEQAAMHMVSFFEKNKLKTKTLQNAALVFLYNLTRDEGPKFRAHLMSITRLLTLLLDERGVSSEFAAKVQMILNGSRELYSMAALIDPRLRRDFESRFNSRLDMGICADAVRKVAGRASLK